MGWLIGWADRKSLVEHLCNDNGVKTLKRFFSGNDMWTVQESKDGVRFICLYKIVGGRGQEWGYKDIDESMGPYETSCPLSFLDLAPVVNAEWREHVKAHHARKNQKVVKGDVVLLTNGRCYKIVSNERGRIRAYSTQRFDDALYRISRRMLVRVVPQLNPIDILREAAVKTPLNSPEWNTLAHAAIFLNGGIL